MLRYYRILHLVAGLACCSWVIDPVIAQSSGKLRYGSGHEQTVAYEIKITADRDDVVETFKGVVTYQCGPANGGIIKATYHGGLTKFSKTKASSSRSRFGPPFGPPRFGPPSFSRFGPFGNTAMRGTTQTTNELTLTTLGQVQSMKGDSQLPYLLGNASLLVFEPLPEQPRQSWSINVGVSITEKGARQGPPYFSPFAQDDPKRTTAGSEVFTYKVRETKGPLVVVDKTYRLDSPAADKNEANFKINGTGTWTFNRNLGVSESLDLKQNLVVKKANTSTTVPMTVTYRRLSADELASHQAEQKKKREELQKKAAEMQAKRAKTPLSAEKKKEILLNLESSNVSKVLMGLQMLQLKTPAEPDPRIGIAVDSLRNHDNRLVKQLAEKAAKKWPVPKDGRSAANTMRTWSDNTGAFTLEAIFVELKDGKVRLRRKDGRELDVPLDRLSDADRKLAETLAKDAKGADNPFEIDD